MKKLEMYKKVLLEADNEAIFEKVSNQYSDDLLEFDEFQIDYFNFLIEIHSQPKYYCQKGLFHFLAIIGVDTDIMSAEQLKAISDSITNNFIYYEDEMLCITACDFIARYYRYEDAKEILLNLKRLEKKKSEKGFADDGLRILNNERRRANKE